MSDASGAGRSAGEDVGGMVARMRAGLAAREAEADMRAAPRIEHLRHTPCDCDLCERAAIAEVDGKLARADAERLAAYEPRHDWAGFGAWHRAYMLELGPMVALRTDPATDPRSTDRSDR